MIIKIKVPVYLWINYKTKPRKRVYLNMNGYRNWHFYLSNQLKKDFKASISKDLNFKTSYINEMTYQLYWKDKRKRDKMNYYAVIDKYFMDALVENNCIKDDNDSFIGDVHALKPILDDTIEDHYCLITINYEGNTI